MSSFMVSFRIFSAFFLNQNLLGECIVKSTKGLTGRFTFQRGGWMSSSKNEVIGEIKDKNGQKCKSLFGRWDEAMYVGEQRQTAKCMWRQHALPQDYEKYYGFTRFAIELNEIIPQHNNSLPHTDRYVLYLKTKLKGN